MLTWFQLGYICRGLKLSEPEIVDASNAAFKYPTDREYFEFWAGWDAHARA